jgi:hypothetical protein
MLHFFNRPNIIIEKDEMASIFQFYNKIFFSLVVYRSLKVNAMTILLYFIE